MIAFAGALVIWAVAAAIELLKTCLSSALSAAALCYVITLVGAFLLASAVAHAFVEVWLSAAAFCYVITLVGAFLLASAVAHAFVEVWQQAAAARGCHIAFWAKATPRVDVGDTPIL